MLSESDFYKNTCRICGSVSGICTNLVENTAVNYLQKVETLIPIKINLDDKLPKKICHVCRTIIHDFYLLREHSVRTQESLKIIAESFNGSKELKNIAESEEVDQQIIAEIVQPEVSKTCRLGVGDDQSKVTNIVQLEVSEVTHSRSTEVDRHKTIENHVEEAKDDETNDGEGKPNMKRWTIQRIPTGDVLCLCNNCNAILTSEASMKTHCCSPKIIQQSVVKTNKNKNKPRTKKMKDISN